MRQAVTLFGFAALLSLVLVWELTTPDPGFDQGLDNAPPRAAPSEPAPATEIDADMLSGFADAAARRPLFSPDRRMASKPATAATVAVDALPRLTGVIVGPTGGVAIFSGPDGRPRRTITGDTIGRYTVRDITPGRVTVSGPGGERVLRPTYATTSTTVSGGPNGAASSQEFVR
jgi:hypothetical protein